MTLKAKHLAIPELLTWPFVDFINIVTVTHNDRNEEQAEKLRAALDGFSDMPYTFQQVNNRANKITYAEACNTGAELGCAPVIGFINPDTEIDGPFMAQVAEVFNSDVKIVITGERFNKPQEEITKWGLHDWVCGAAFFVRREWFDYVRGFDIRYPWSYEETDLCRAAERGGFNVQSISLAMAHNSPLTDSAKDKAFKKRGFEKGQLIYERKWPA